MALTPSSFLVQEEDDGGENGLGPGGLLTAALHGRQEREERSWAGFGQERKRENFFPYPLFYFYFFVFKTFAQFEFI
jgi:hypothetical protein